MTSSSFFNVELRSTNRLLIRRSFDRFELPTTEASELSVEAETRFSIVVQRATAETALRLRLGNEPIAEVHAGQAEFRSERQAWFWNEFGNSSLRIERQIGAERPRFELLYELPLRIAARPPVLRDYGVMMHDLQGIHEHLAHDVIGRSHHRHGLSSDDALPLRPELLFQSIQKIQQRLSESLAAIAQQPSKGLVRKTVMVNYRGGERIDTAGLQSLARDPLTSVDASGRIQRLGKLRVRRPSVTLDLPEHRQIAQAIRDLAKRALVIGAHCRKSIELLELEKDRWGRTRADAEVSVYEQRELPRIEQLEEVAKACPGLAKSLRKLIDQYEFLAEAGVPRSPFGPTPAFLGRSAYRAIYDTLREARQPLGILVDGDALRIAYRNLATLYEYWCFMKVIEHLRLRFGPPDSKQAFSLIDDVYRPELSPEQEFRFTIDEDRYVVASYTPEFLPTRQARQAGLTYGASLTDQPLRPDVTLELRQPTRRPVMLVLDAKSTENFAVRRLRELSDYSRQVVDLRTSYQPIRQVFLMHRDRNQRPLVNLPGYLRGRSVDRYSVAIGAIPCAPEHIGFAPPLLGTVIDRFLETHVSGLRLTAPTS